MWSGSTDNRITLTVGDCRYILEPFQTVIHCVGVVGLVVSMNGGNSVLGNYFIKSSALSRPNWWLAALHDAKILTQVCDSLLFRMPFGYQYTVIHSL